MPESNSDTAIKVFAEAVQARDFRIADLELETKTLRSRESQWRVYLHNICGMAIEKFPELAQGFMSRTDNENLPHMQYEVIRLALGKIPKWQPTPDTSTAPAASPKHSENSNTREGR